MAISLKYMIRRLTLFLLLIFIALSSHAQQPTTPSNALQHYLHNGDTTYHWILKDSFRLKGMKGYNLLLISQQWRQYTWKHQLTILEPKENKHDGALLFIDGGHNDKETLKPHWSKPDKLLIQVMAKVATKNKAMVSLIRQIPNEPLFDSLTEDQIISYTLHQFLQNKDYTWPLLFPMVKGAVRAMDAIQEFSNHKLHHPIHRFVVAGASKRGWTTWLTGANDPRVVAIGPMVIDILNMPVNLAHQMEAYGSYSRQINDYVKLGIVQGMGTSGGRALVKMIDPYSYRKKLTMPKMLFMGTNDPYWVIDNVKNYLPDIPGINLINYTPNAGHGLNHGTTAFPALSAFFSIIMNHGKLPECSWKTRAKRNHIKVVVKASKKQLLGVKVWYADAKNKDFRDEDWHSRNLNISHKKRIVVKEPLPTDGYHAFYVELTYKNKAGQHYTVCTRAFMTDEKEIL